MDEYNVDFVLGGHDHVYSRSYVLKDGQRNSERLDTLNNPQGTILYYGVTVVQICNIIHRLKH